MENSNNCKATLIIGGAGFIGSSLCEELLRDTLDKSVKVPWTEQLSKVTSFVHGNKKINDEKLIVLLDIFTDDPYPSEFKYQRLRDIFNLKNLSRLCVSDNVHLYPTDLSFSLTERNGPHPLAGDTSSSVPSAGVSTDSFIPYKDVEKDNIPYVYECLFKTPAETSIRVVLYRFRTLTVNGIAGILRNHCISLVYHLAANPGVRSNSSDDSYRNTYESVVTLCSAIDELDNESSTNPVEKVIFSSTSSVYDESNVNVNATDEDSPKLPKSKYGEWKLNAEYYFEFWMKKRRDKGRKIVNVGIARLYSVYGPRGRPDMAPLLFLASAYQGKPISMIAERGCVSGKMVNCIFRDYTYIRDAVRALRLFGSTDYGPPCDDSDFFSSSTKKDKIITPTVINIGSGNPEPLGKLIDEIQKILHREIPFLIRNPNGKDMYKTHANNDKARKILDWFPETTLTTGMRKLHSWYVNNCIGTMGVFAVIATKDRTEELLERCLKSVLNQTIRPLAVIIVNDDKDSKGSSTAKVQRVAEKCFGNNLEYYVIENKRTRGASGAWNTGIFYAASIVTASFLKINHKEYGHILPIPWNRTFIAILDDDDEWTSRHLELCLHYARMSGGQQVIPGIQRFERGKEVQYQTIPNANILEPSVFYCGNPHIQGSNMFISLQLFCMAGLFNEALQSTTDRDLMARITRLPTYETRLVSFGNDDNCLNYTTEHDKSFDPHFFHTVRHYADDNRDRLTNNLSTKRQGLKKYLSIHGTAMTDVDQKQFTQRAIKIFSIDPLAPENHSTVSINAPIIDKYASLSVNTSNNDANGSTLNYCVIQQNFQLQPSTPSPPVARKVIPLIIGIISNANDGETIRPLLDDIRRLKLDPFGKTVASSINPNDEYTSRYSLEPHVVVFENGFYDGINGLANSCSPLQSTVLSELSRYGIPTCIFTIDDYLQEIETAGYPKDPVYHAANNLKSGMGAGGIRKLEITYSRTILQRYVYAVAEGIDQVIHHVSAPSSSEHHKYNRKHDQEPIIWILDDDKSFTPLVVRSGSNVPSSQWTGGRIVWDALKIQEKEQAHIVLGCDTEAPPLPAHTSLRLQLLDVLGIVQMIQTAGSLDYIPCTCSSVRAPDVKCPSPILFSEEGPDYYHDFSSQRFNHLEEPVCPICLIKSSCWGLSKEEEVRATPADPTIPVQYALQLLIKFILPQIIAGAAITRPLMVHENDIHNCTDDRLVRESFARGGCTFIFDRNALLVPNLSPTLTFPGLDGVNDSIHRSTRRSDMIWCIMNKNQFFRRCVLSTGLVVRHRRTQNESLASLQLHDPVLSRSRINQRLQTLYDDVLGNAIYRAVIDVHEPTNNATYDPEVFLDRVKYNLFERSLQASISFLRIHGLLSSIENTCSRSMYNLSQSPDASTDISINQNYAWISSTDSGKQLETLLSTIRHEFSIDSLVFNPTSIPPECIARYESNADGVYAAHTLQIPLMERIFRIFTSNTKNIKDWFHQYFSKESREAEYGSNSNLGNDLLIGKSSMNWNATGETVERTLNMFRSRSALSMVFSLWDTQDSSASTKWRFTPGLGTLNRTGSSVIPDSIGRSAVTIEGMGKEGIILRLPGDIAEGIRKALRFCSSNNLSFHHDQYVALKIMDLYSLRKETNASIDTWEQLRTLSLLWEDNKSSDALLPLSFYEIASPTITNDDVVHVNSTKIIMRPWINGNTYEGGHGPAIIAFLQYLRTKQVCCNNISPDNVLVMNHDADGINDTRKLILIDYGLDIQPFSEQRFRRMMLRTFLMWRWAPSCKTNSAVLRSVLSKARNAIENVPVGEPVDESKFPEAFGYSVFEEAVHSDSSILHNRYMDFTSEAFKKVFERVCDGKRRSSVLDVGCGKIPYLRRMLNIVCKFPLSDRIDMDNHCTKNTLYHPTNTTDNEGSLCYFVGYDPNASLQFSSSWKTVQDLSNNNVSLRLSNEWSRETIHNSYTQQYGFDIILCFRVLCVIESDDNVRNLLYRIYYSLHEKGLALLSICHPAAGHVRNSTLQIREIVSTSNHIVPSTETSILSRAASTQIRKQLLNGQCRYDYHRPLHRLLRLIRECGLCPVFQEDYPLSIDTNRFERISETLLLGLCRRKLSILRNISPSFQPSSFSPLLAFPSTLPPVYENAAASNLNQSTVIPNTFHRSDSVALLIKTCAAEVNSITMHIEHLVSQLEGPHVFSKGIWVVVDSRRENFPRPYNQTCVSDLENLLQKLERLKLNGIIDNIIYPSVSSLHDLPLHAENGSPIYSTINAFHVLMDAGVEIALQIDSDMLIRRSRNFGINGRRTLPSLSQYSWNTSVDDSNDYVADAIDLFNTDPLCLTLSLPVPVDNYDGFDKRTCMTYRDSNGLPWRTEVRGCFMHLPRLFTLCSRTKMADYYKETSTVIAWYRLVDKFIRDSSYRSYRGGDSQKLSVLHPPNALKVYLDEFSLLLDYVERGGPLPGTQKQGFMDVQTKTPFNFIEDGGVEEYRKLKIANKVVQYPYGYVPWIRTEDYVYVIIGRKIEPSRIRRCLDSMIAQEWKNPLHSTWGCVIVWDSPHESAPVSDDCIAPSWKDVEWNLEYLVEGGGIPQLIGRCTLLRPRIRCGGIFNTINAIRLVCRNTSSVIMLLDMDDALIGSNVSPIVQHAFADNGVNVLCGGMLRMDKVLSYAKHTDGVTDCIQTSYQVTFPSTPTQLNSNTISASIPRLNPGAGNVWSHFRCARKYMFDAIPEARLREKGSPIDHPDTCETFKYRKRPYYDHCIDWVLMIPLVEMAWKYAEITFPVYFYEPFRPLFSQSLQAVCDHRATRENNILPRILFDHATGVCHHIPIIAVIGDASYSNPKKQSHDTNCSNVLSKNFAAVTAFNIGREIRNNGMYLVCGGLGGAMEKAAEGYHHDDYNDAVPKLYHVENIHPNLRIAVRQHEDSGKVIGLLPSSQGFRGNANNYTDVALRTGIGTVRNDVIGTAADVVIVIGGGAGTLHEASVAWSNGRLIIAMKGTGGTADLIANTRLDQRSRLHGIASSDIYLSMENDRVHEATSVKEAMQYIHQHIHWHILEAIYRKENAQINTAQII